MAATALQIYSDREMIVVPPEYQLAQLSSDISALLLSNRTHSISENGRARLDKALDAFVDLGDSARELSAEIDDYLRRFPPSKL